MSKIITIKNNKPRLYTMNGVTLQPGLNKLEEKEAKKFLSHPHAKIKQDRGFFEVGKPVKVKAEVKAKPADPKIIETEVGATDTKKAAVKATPKAAVKPVVETKEEAPAEKVAASNTPSPAELVEIITSATDEELLATASQHENATVKRAAIARIAELTV